MKKLAILFIFLSWLVAKADHFDEYMRRNNIIYPWQADSTSLNVDSLWSEYYLAKVNVYNINNQDSAAYYLELSKHFIEENHLENFLPNLYFSYGKYFFAREDLDSAMSYFDLSLKHSLQQKDTAFASLSLTNLAILYLFQSKDSKFLKTAKEAIKFNTYAEKHIANMNLWFKLAKYHVKHQDTVKANAAAYSAVSSAEASKNFIWIPYAKTHFSHFQLGIGNISLADSITKTLIAIADTIYYKKLAQEIYSIRAKIYNEQKDSKNALLFLDKAIKVNPIESTFDSLNFNLSYADAYANGEEYERAILLYKKVLDTKTGRYDLELDLRTLDKLIEILAKTKQYEEIFRYSELRNKIYKEYVNQQNIDIRNKYEVELQLQENELKVKTFELDAQTSKKDAQMLAFMIVLVLIISIAIVIRIRLTKKHMQLKLENAKLQQTIEHEKHISILKKKENELLEQTKTIAEKQEIIFKLQTEIDKNKSQNIPTFSLEQILEEIQKDTMSLESFDLRFNELFPDFYSSLFTKCKNLTQSEVRVCALIKLNMSSKEIANLLCVALSTINNHRFNIRKKLNIENRSNLFDILQNLHIL